MGRREREGEIEVKKERGGSQLVYDGLTDLLSKLPYSRKLSRE